MKWWDTKGMLRSRITTLQNCLDLEHSKYTHAAKLATDQAALVTESGNALVSEKARHRLTKALLDDAKIQIESHKVVNKALQTALDDTYKDFDEMRLRHDIFEMFFKQVSINVEVQTPKTRRK